MKTLIVVLSLFCFVNLYCQEDDDITSYKIAFITDRLDLSSKQAQVFWPIYNKHNRLYEDLKKNTWEPIREGLNKIDKLSNQEAEKLLDDYRSYKKKRYEYREAYIKELLTVISPKKIMQLKKADYDFNRELLKQYQSK
ncbi:MAG: hypothetical protein GVY05_04155 [Bacteroidetes bacterium]|jgi:GTP-binding protein EngB required for normal cell division|nr:hypothetical protein [Bacteroidota bacterium]